MSSRKVTLHIGAMKTGTTYVQRMLGTNAKVLAEQGITYPKPWSDQVEAVRDALKLQGGSHRGSIEGRWDLMVNRLNTTDGDRAILSSGVPLFRRRRSSARPSSRVCGRWKST